MPRKTDLQAGSKLSEHLGFAAEMFGLRIDSECVWRPLCVKGLSFAAAEDRAHTRPCIRRETSARNWISQRKGAEDRANRMIMVDPPMNKYRDRLVLEDIETGLVRVQRESFHTDTNVAAEEIFNVATAAPSVIATDVAIIGAKNRTTFTGALYDIDQRRIRRELGVGERIRAPEIQIPFAIAVPLGARRYVCDLLHFFS